MEEMSHIDELKRRIELKEQLITLFQQDKEAALGNAQRYGEIIGDAIDRIKVLNEARVYADNIDNRIASIRREIVGLKDQITRLVEGDAA